MPKNVKFTQDYRGVLTAEAFYRAGETVALSDAMADQVIAHGRATAVPGRQPAKAAEPTPDPSIMDAPIKVIKAKRTRRKRPAKRST